MSGGWAHLTHLPLGFRGSAGRLLLCLDHSGPASLCFGLRLCKAAFTDSDPIKQWLQVLPSSQLTLSRECFPVLGARRGGYQKEVLLVPRGAIYFRSGYFVKASSRAPICHCHISIPTEDCGCPKPAIKEGCGLCGRPGHWATFPSIPALPQAWDQPPCTPLTQEHCRGKEARSTELW